MAFLKSEDHFSVSAIRLFVKSLLVIVLGAGSFVVARVQDSQSNKGDESWTATAESNVENLNPVRTTESHDKSGNRSVDEERVEVLGSYPQKTRKWVNFRRPFALHFLLKT